MSKETLTPMVFKVYFYILKQNPNYVTDMQIADALNMTNTAVWHHIQKLLKMRYLSKRTNPVRYRAKNYISIQPLTDYLSLANQILSEREKT